MSRPGTVRQVSGANDGQLGRSASLVGRQAELDAIRGVLAAGRSVALVGARGVGRSALARAVGERERAAGRRVVRLTPSRATAATPLGVFAGLLPAGTPTTGADGLAHAARALTGTGSAPLIVVDDAQWIDPLSAAVLLDAAAARAAQAVVTVRLDDPLPDALLRLWKDSVAELVDVAPPDERSLGDIAAGHLDGGSVDPAAVRVLADLSGRELPAFISLLERARRAGSLTSRRGVWRLTGPVPVNEALVLVDGAAAELADDERLAVDVLRVGGPMSADALLTITVEECLDRLETAGVVVFDCDEDRRLRVRLRVPARAMPAPGPTLARRRRLTAVADALDAGVRASGGSRLADADDLLASVRLRHEAGGELDPPTTLRAARVALRRGRLDDAAALASAVECDTPTVRADVGAGGTGRSTVGSRVAAHLLLAEVETRRGRAEDAEARLAELAPGLTDPVEIGAVACAHIDHLLNTLFLPERAWAIAREAAPRLAGTSHAAGVAVRQGLLALVGGDLHGGAAMVELALADLTGNALVAGCWIAAYDRVMRGRSDGALALLNRAAEATHAPAVGTVDGDLPPWDERTLDSLRCMALGVSGRGVDAEALARRRHEAAIADGDANGQALFAWCRAGLALTAGRAGTAQRRAAEANAIYADVQAPTQQRLALHDLARAMALLGNAAGGRDALQAAEAIDQRFGRDLWAESGRLRSEAWLAAADGESDTARAFLEELLVHATANGEPLNELAARHDLVRFGASGQADALSALAAAFDGPYAAAIAAYACGVEDGNAAQLSSAVDGFEAMALPLFAAEASAALADALGRAGCSREAANAGARAAAFASLCEGASTPALTERGVLANLSRRETEVARLAAAGLANREIAARLYVSVRTVESQLQRAYAKLGIRSRYQLAAALDPDPRTT